MTEAAGEDRCELVTLRAAVLACWPAELDKVSAIRAIKAGEVERQGSVERSHGKRNVAPTDMLRWRGETKRIPPPLFVALHKPAGYISTTVERGLLPKPEADEDAETAAAALTVYDVLKHPSKQHLRAVGRLDKDTEGLLLFTTHGRWAWHLTAPASQCAKTYRCWLEHPATDTDLQTWLRGGLRFRDRKCGDDGMATAAPAVSAVFVEDGRGQKREENGGSGSSQREPPQTHCVVDITIIEGRYRQVRRCWEELGNRVIRLVRLEFGPVQLGELAPGTCRELSQLEVAALRRCVVAAQHAGAAAAR